MSSKAPEETVTIEVASPLWSTTVVENVELVEIWRRYEVAPVMSFQSSVGVTVTAAAAGGESSTGATIDVVKFRLADHGPCPLTLAAATRQ